MTTPPTNLSNYDLQSPLLAELDERCDRFETAWCAGENPRIEDAIEGVEDPLRSRLLEELVTLEVAYRRQQGKSPNRAEYETRFPHDRQLVHKAFGDDQRAGTPSEHAETVQLGGSSTPSGRLEIRCPSCQTPMHVLVDTSLTELTCAACGNHFSLVDQSQATRLARPLSELGRFELLERLGVGGFGSVWRARDKELDRTVALKIPRQGSMAPEDQERFYHEARAVAQLRHPNIVSVHEVGRDGDLVYIVSDFVQGMTLDDWLTGQQLTGREAAELCAKIADALHHAHEAGIVHRDLKPGNILMDSDLEPHLMDFGLARREVGEATLTLEGHVLGTPAYMSPEQARGEAHQADRRSDVYSLGVILFQLLTGERPFRGNARMLVHQVLNDDPPSPRKLNAHVPMDLETITLKCLEKDPAQRYQTAAAVADELRRYLADEPIKARPIGRVCKAWRWSRKRPTLVALGLVTCFLIGLAFMHRQSAQSAGVQSYVRNVQLAYAAWRERDVDHARELLKRCSIYPGEADQHDFAWNYLWGKCQLSERPWPRADQTFLHTGHVTALAISCDGTKVASGGTDVLRVWNAKTGTLEWERKDLGEQIRSLALSRDGAFLVSSGGSLSIWNLTHDSQVKLPNAGSAIHCVALSNDGTLLASGHKSGVVRLWDLRNQELLTTLGRHAKAVRSVVFSPDGKTLASGDVVDSVRLWDVSSGQQVAALVGRDVAFTPDGHMIAAAGQTHLVQLWDVSGNTGPKALPGIETRGTVKDLAFADNRLLTIAYDTGQWETCDVSRGAVVTTLHGKSSQSNVVCLSPRGAYLASATRSEGDSELRGIEDNAPAGMSRVQLWQVKRENPHESVAITTDWLMSVVLGREGKSLAMATGRFSKPFAAESGTAIRLIIDTGDKLPLPDVTVDGVKALHWLCLALSPDNAWLACGGYSSDQRGATKGIVVLQPMHAETSNPIVLRHKDWVRAVAYSHDGDLMAVGGRLGPTALWDVHDPQKPQKRGEVKVPSWALEFSPDDKVLAAGGGQWNHGVTSLVGVASLDVLEATDDPAGLVTAVAFLPHDQEIAAADYKGRITIYNRHLQTRETLLAHDAGIRSLALSAPSESTAILASAGEDGVVKLWHLPTRTLLCSFPNSVAAYSLSFADDGSALAAGKADGTVKLWRIQGEDRVFRCD